MSEVRSLYLNGLGNGNLRKREQWLLDKQRKAGIEVVTANINWRTSKNFRVLRDQIADQADQLLAKMDELDRLVLNGTSAGVCLALAARDAINDPRLRVIGHSGRVHDGDLALWDPRNMERCAHLGTDEESLSFYDGVSICENEVIPRMTQDQKDKTILTTPFAGLDLIVPGSTMPIEGVRNVVVPVVGHVLAIGYGMSIMPSLVDQMP